MEITLPCHPPCWSGILSLPSEVLGCDGRATGRAVLQFESWEELTGAAGEVATYLHRVLRVRRWTWGGEMRMKEALLATATP